MERFDESTGSLILFGVLLIILALSLTVFKEDKVEDTLQKAIIKLPNNEIVTGCLLEGLLIPLLIRG